MLQPAGKLVLPRISNTNSKGEWYADGLSALFSNTKATDVFINQIISVLDRFHADGVNLDIEGVKVADEKAFVDWLEKITDALHARGLIVTVDVPMGVDGYDLKTISAISDAVVVMAYDEHFPTGQPGSIAGLDWFDDGLEDTLISIPRDKLIVGIGAYGYDWTDGKITAEPIGFYDAIRLATRFGAQVETDSTTINSRFAYKDDAGKNHRVWLLDAVSAWNEVLTVRRSGARGLAVWRTGSEEPALWSFFGTATLPAFKPQSLETIPALPTVSFRGKGSLLRVVGEPNEGYRKVEFDGDSIVRATISTLPSGFRVNRPALHAGKQLALTFDDGPDPIWTPQILAILAKYGIRATFFVIGDQAERYPQIVREEFAAGHLLGNHTYFHPHLNEVSDSRLKWEINATQRLIQALTGHSTTLFRSPYNAHAEPRSPEELHEFRQATQLGYLVVGTDIDLEDYEALADDGLTRNIVNKLHDGEAHVIEFHDAGGDRHWTAEALDKLIPQLLAQGYQFVGIDDLLGVKKTSLMPPITDLEHVLGFARRTVVWFHLSAWEVLLGLFFATTAMSIGKILTLALLLVRGKFSANKRLVPCFTPDVRVLIPAHNEAKVITQTIEAVLRSDYPRLRVAVIDDGSTDETARIVGDCVKANSRLALIIQADCSGKAAALNRGFNEAHEDYVITIDADTVVFPHTVRALVEPFSDPAVDAVCGNVQVGNIRNTLTRFQHVEYVTSQNYERRAFGTVNCISVVPGATAAWKRRKVLEVGGYSEDTLTEDTDLTLILLGCDGRIVYAPLAQSITEAPEKISTLFRQRYRWTFGTLQCLWKHRNRWGRGSLGCITLANILVFQFLFPVLAPLGDALLIKCVLRRELVPVATAYLVFLGLDFISPIIAFRLDRQHLRHASVVIIQRFFYRQFMYAVTFAALVGALRGKRNGWDKLNRTGASLSPTWSDGAPVPSLQLEFQKETVSAASVIVG